MITIHCYQKNKNTRCKNLKKKCYIASHKISFISLLLYFVVLLFSELEFIMKSFSFFGVVAGVGGGDGDGKLSAQNFE